MGMNSILLLVTALSISISAWLWFAWQQSKQKVTLPNKQEENLMEASTLYNASPVKWQKQNKYMGKKRPRNHINQEGEFNQTLYILDDNEINQQLLKQYAIENKYNALFFGDLQEMSDFYMKESQKLNIESRFMPDCILVSDMCGALDLVKMQEKNNNTNIKLIILSQNPAYGGGKAITLARPINHTKIHYAVSLAFKQ